MKKTSILFPFLFLLTFSIPLEALPSLQEPFDEIRVAGKIRLVLEAGDTEAVRILHEEDKVNVEVKAGVLYVKRKERWKYSSYKNAVEVRVTYRKLRGISADAGAIVSSSEPLVTSESLRLSFGSGATTDLEVNLEDLQVNVGEGATVELTGYTDELDAKASTGGILQAFDLQSKRTYAKANTGGQVMVTALESIEASAHTGGMIDYRGNPGKMNVSGELGGRVESRGM